MRSRVYLANCPTRIEYLGSAGMLFYSNLATILFAKYLIASTNLPKLGNIPKIAGDSLNNNELGHKQMTRQRKLCDIGTLQWCHLTVSISTKCRTFETAYVAPPSSEAGNHHRLAVKGQQRCHCRVRTF